MSARDTVYIRAVNQAAQETQLYLHLDAEERLPLVLGTGRNAVVFLARTTNHRETQATEYRAIKFLRDDIDTQYARASANRFFQEATKAMTFDRLQGTFVTYFGWGAVGKPESPDEKGVYRDFWWQDQLKHDVERLLDDNEINNSELDRIRRHFKLQGPFYVLDLCQGTLYDLLDKHTPWLQLPTYSITKFRESLLMQTGRVASDIQLFRQRYLKRHPARRSGYDILNEFLTGEEANRIRSYAVLEVFRQVALTVSELHKRKVPMTAGLAPQSEYTTASMREPLAHRDLKPGNIFFKHDANLGGLNSILIKLSDLGYVTNAYNITSGDRTLHQGHRGIEYQAPGSQYYRAPEQDDLPVEVRVDVDGSNRQIVRVRGSKVDRIEIHDWLLLSDLFNDDERTSTALEDPRLFKIHKARRHQDSRGDYHELELHMPVSTTRHDDLQGHIVRSTGFQTDGFSLGAILYDLISGGRNPQLFYIYCVRSLLSYEGISVESIVDVLAPNHLTLTGTHSGDDLNYAKRRLMMRALFDVRQLEELLELMLKIAFQPMPFAPAAKLRLRERLQISGDVMEQADIDDLVATLVRSDRYTVDIPTGDDHALEPSMKDHLADELRKYRFRKFQLVSDLLQDKRGVSIPRDILRIIVACMVRDIEGSYYHCDESLGYTSPHNLEAATRIHDDINALMGHPSYRLPERGFPRSLEDNLLFKLRSLAGDASEDGEELGGVS